MEEEDRAATLGELRSTRRWLAVAAVWAVAATALAVIALLEANQEDDTARTQAAGELGRVQRGLNERIDELESRIDELATSEDVSNLDDRLGELEGRRRPDPERQRAPLGPGRRSRDARRGARAGERGAADRNRPLIGQAGRLPGLLQ